MLGPMAFCVVDWYSIAPSPPPTSFSSRLAGPVLYHYSSIRNCQWMNITTELVVVGSGFRGVLCLPSDVVGYFSEQDSCRVQVLLSTQPSLFISMIWID